MCEETRRQAQDGGGGGCSGVTGEGGSDRDRLLERPPDTGREPRTKTQPQDDCAWVSAPHSRNRRSGLTRGETIAGSGGGVRRQE